MKETIDFDSLLPKRKESTASVSKKAANLTSLDLLSKYSRFSIGDTITTTDGGSIEIKDANFHFSRKGLEGSFLVDWVAPDGQTGSDTIQFSSFKQWLD